MIPFQADLIPKDLVPTVNLPPLAQMLTYVVLIAGMVLVIFIGFKILNELKKRKEYNVLNNIYEEINGAVYLVRHNERGGVFDTKHGQEYRFLHEKPRVNPPPPNPSAQITDHPLVVRQTKEKPARQSIEIERERRVLWFFKKRDKVTVLPWNERDAKGLIPGRGIRLVNWLKKDGQYYTMPILPHDWVDEQNRIDPKFKSVTATARNWFFRQVAQNYADYGQGISWWERNQGAIFFFTGGVALVGFGILIYLGSKVNAEAATTVASSNLEIMKTQIELANALGELQRQNIPITPGGGA
jgi:hypothetical protein